MAFNLEEQEQMEDLRAFWERWGKWLKTIAVVGVLAYAGMRAYNSYGVQQSQKASQVYESYVMAMQKKDAGADAILASLQKDYAQSRYTALASLDAANAAIADKAWDKAQVPLQWLSSNGTVENQAVARLQLADVLVQAGKNDDAVKALSTLPAPEFTAAFANKKADVYAMMNDNTKARESMQAALTWVQAQPIKDSELETALQAKLDLLPH